MTAEAGIPADARAVLIGVSDYDHPGFPPIRAARNSLQAMRALLADPALCGWPPGQVTVIENPASAADLADQVADLAESTTGVLLLYYVGHGVLSTRGELCLTVTSTRPSRPQFSGLAWENVTYILHGCPARVRLVILDCCFAGQAIEALSTDGEPGLADIAHVNGVYTLTATTRNRPAHVVPPDQQDTACTSFTGELRGLIQSGIPGRSGPLTLGDIYPVLRQRLRDRGLPAPSQRGTDTAYLFPFTANAADQVQAHAGPSTADAAALADHHGNGAGETLQAVQPSVPAGRPEVIRLLDDATRAALAVPGEKRKATALAHVASVVAAFDPDRAAQLINRAEQLIQATADKRMDYSRAAALTEVAVAVAAADPDRAERIAQSIRDGRAAWRRTALTEVAVAVAAADPDRAERIAQSVDSGKGSRRRDKALAAVAAALAVTDPGRAERITQSITSEGPWRDEALAAVAAAFAVTDPDRAERIAESIAPGEDAWRDEALAAVAAAFAVTDPDRAERIARLITYERWAAAPLGAVAEAVRVSDPDRSRRLAVEAERDAEAYALRSEKGETYARFAKALAATDPYQARSHAKCVIRAESKAAEVLAEVAKVLAATDPDEAEQVARSIVDSRWNAMALAEVAVAVAATDPDRAERLAYAVDDEVRRSQALAGIAMVLAGYHPVGLMVRPPEF